MKRPVWSAQEALRQDETSAVVVPPSHTTKLTEISLQFTPSGECSEPRATVQLSGDAFYDDWLHRGTQEPVRNMNHYIYGMYIRPMKRSAANLEGFTTLCEFDVHYTKWKSHVQVVMDVPAVPYLQGFQMPSVSSDGPTNAMFQQVLLRPTRCPGAGYCRNPCAHSLRYCEQYVAVGQ